jgi:hypothetical protein
MINSDRIPKDTWKYHWKENKFGKTCSNDIRILFLSPATCLNKLNTGKDDHDDNSLETSVLYLLIIFDNYFSLIVTVQPEPQSQM